MRGHDLFDLYEKKIMENKDFYYNDYQRVKKEVANSSAIYKGKPVQFLYQPMFFDEEDINNFKGISKGLVRILYKVIEEYIKNPAFRKHFGFSPLMEELVLVDPGYQYKFPMARFDLFYSNGDEAKFCELNADGASSMNETRVLYDIISRSHALDCIKDKHSFYDFELFDSWIDAIIKDYKEFWGENKNPQNIAIMDFEGEGIISEFEIFKQKFIERGYNTIICDPRELKYKGGKLYYSDLVIDLIYRRATTARIIDEAEHIQDFIKAYRDGNVCVVGGLVSQLIHNKRIFAVLHDENTQYIFDQADRAYIKKHIPYTGILTKEDNDILKYISQSREGMVLKPFDLYAANGVFIGRDFNQVEWDKLISKFAGQGYLFQELCDIPRRNMLTIDNEQMYFEKYNHMLGLFMYNEAFTGLYSRVGRKNVIASIQESFTVPNFVVERIA